MLGLIRAQISSTVENFILLSILRLYPRTEQAMEKRKVTAIYCIKTYFGQVDKITPYGGRGVTMDELKELGKYARDKIGAKCAAALGLTMGADL